MESRVYLYDNPVSTSLRANHTTPQKVDFIVSDGPRGFQFMSIIPLDIITGSSGPAGPLSSLSGSSISGFKTFTESGLQRRVVLSIGPFWRF